jgi:hypothetical protein
MFGVDYRYEMISFGAEFITDLISPADAQAGNGTITVPTGPRTSVIKTDKDVLSGEHRQWSMVLQLGVLF